MFGPLVLFAIRAPSETGPIELPANALLQAEQSGPAEWTVHAPTGPRRFVPFTGIGDQTYSTYVTLA